MNQNFNQLQVRFPSLGCWLFLLGTAWLLGAIGIGTLIKSLFALALFLLLAPVVAFIALRFWLKRNLVESNCPVCDQPLTSFKNIKTSCPSCGAELSATDNGFERTTTEGVIDIQAVDIQANAVDLSETTSAPVIDVEVQQLPEANSQ